MKKILVVLSSLLLLPVASSAGGIAVLVTEKHVSSSVVENVSVSLHSIFAYLAALIS